MALHDDDPVHQYDFAVNDNQSELQPSVNLALTLDPNPLDVISIGDPQRSIQQSERSIGHTTYDQTAGPVFYGPNTIIGVHDTNPASYAANSPTRDTEVSQTDGQLNNSYIRGTYPAGLHHTGHPLQLPSTASVFPQGLASGSYNAFSSEARPVASQTVRKRKASISNSARPSMSSHKRNGQAIFNDRVRKARDQLCSTDIQMVAPGDINSATHTAQARSNFEWSTIMPPSVSIGRGATDMQHADMNDTHDLNGNSGQSRAFQIAHDSFARPQHATSEFSGSVASASAQASNYPQCPTTSSVGPMHAPSPPQANSCYIYALLNPIRVNGQEYVKLAWNNQTKTLLIDDELTLFDQNSRIEILPNSFGKKIYFFDSGFLWMESLRPKSRYKIFEAYVVLPSSDEHPDEGISEKTCEPYDCWLIPFAIHNGKQWEAFYDFLVHTLGAERVETCAKKKDPMVTMTMHIA
ncbi:hypothetical protein FB567DRAFT_611384 [Paraphoma chrysanthemicola]|uniref:Uncharacterized protein n=1 Tax=Paraphoma chrysanthemicola TaxID=798071 RepID=A0A8K0QW14_9PLEO|nr:hypothetical protein FB567DRAFT_611384 [Paraphoma chrysanthemicola]